MPRAKLRLTIPEEVWVGEATRRYPEAEIRILAALGDETEGVGLAEISAADPGAVLAEMETYEDVDGIELLKSTDSEVLVQFETTMPLLLLPARDSGVPLEMPFSIQDGTAVWEITAPSDRLSALGSQLEAFGISFTVEYVRDRLDEEQLLTDRQQRIVSVAIEQGYYDTPRECSLTDLADHLDLAKSTLSETLHRAEEKMVKRFAENLDVAPAV
ncbi:MAG: putative DNA binding protein [Haloarculaceae archaeon]|jgi:predicted DNA binding protein